MFDTFVVFMAGFAAGALLISIVWWVAVTSQTAADARAAAKRRAAHIPRRLLNEPGEGAQHAPSPVKPTRRPRAGDRVTWDLDQ